MCEYILIGAAPSLKGMRQNITLCMAEWIFVYLIPANVSLFISYEQINVRQYTSSKID